MRIALKFAYNGLIFHGFARQPNLSTVEGEIIKHLIEKKIIKNPKDSVYGSASRNDKYVSAFGNVIAFDTTHSEDTVIDELSNIFDDIIFYASANVGSDFYPRYARLRHYRYYLKSIDFDIDKIIQTLSCFTGEHNFSNFARVESGKNPIRKIDNIVVEQVDDFLLIDFFAQNFLRNQIRRIVSSVVRVGNSKVDVGDIKYALDNPDDRKDFGVESAKPLVLMDVIYNFSFKENPSQTIKLKKLENRIISNIKNM